MQGMNWEFVVADNPDCQAFALPGKVMVTTGMLTMVGLNDNKLAWVIAHEIAHTVQRSTVGLLLSMKDLL